MDTLILPKRARSTKRGVGATFGGSPIPPAPWEFILPENLYQSDLSPKLWQHMDDVRYLASTVVRKTMRRGDGYARLRTDYLRRVMSPRKMPLVISELEDHGHLEVKRSYLAGSFSRGYRLTKACRESRHVRVRPTSPSLIAKLQCFADRVAKKQERRQRPIHRALNEIQHRHLTIDEDQAKRTLLAELQPQSRLCQGVLIDNLVRRTLGSSVSSTGRYFNAITGLSKELRPCLRLDGESLGAVDLACCQPALLGMLIHQSSPAIGRKVRSTLKVARLLPPSLLSLVESEVEGTLVSSREFVELASTGSFYYDLASRANLPREDVKMRFIIDVLAPKGVYPSHVRDVFEEAFPGVAAVIRAINSTNYRRMIRLLQRLEAELVVETVAPRLVENIPIVTLHDAIFSRERDVPIVKEAFEDTFAEMGYRISMKTETSADWCKAKTLPLAA